MGPCTAKVEVCTDSLCPPLKRWLLGLCTGSLVAAEFWLCSCSARRFLGLESSSHSLRSINRVVAPTGEPWDGYIAQTGGSGKSNGRACTQKIRVTQHMGAESRKGNKEKGERVVSISSLNGDRIRRGKREKKQGTLE